MYLKVFHNEQVNTCHGGIFRKVQFLSLRLELYLKMVSFKNQFCEIFQGQVFDRMLMNNYFCTTFIAALLFLYLKALWNGSDNY